MADDGGLSRIQQRLNSIPKRVKEAAAKASKQAAENVAEDMRQFARGSKKTGKLIDSIQITGPNSATPPYSQPGGGAVVPDGTHRITAGNKDVRYAHLVEYGHGNGFVKGAEQGTRGQAVPAQPFFWPAVRANKKTVLNTINKAVRKTLKDTWGK